MNFEKRKGTEILAPPSKPSLMDDCMGEKFYPDFRDCVHATYVLPGKFVRVILAGCQRPIKRSSKHNTLQLELLGKVNALMRLSNKLPTEESA